MYTNSCLLRASQPESNSNLDTPFLIVTNEHDIISASMIQQKRESHKHNERRSLCTTNYTRIELNWIAYFRQLVQLIWIEMKSDQQRWYSEKCAKVEQ